MLLVQGKNKVQDNDYDDDDDDDDEHPHQTDRSCLCSDNQANLKVQMALPSLAECCVARKSEVDQKCQHRAFLPSALQCSCAAITAPACKLHPTTAVPTSTVVMSKPIP